MTCCFHVVYILYNIGQWCDIVSSWWLVTHVVNLLWFLHICDVRQILPIVVVCLMTHQKAVHLWLSWLTCINLQFPVCICYNYWPFVLLSKIMALLATVVSFLLIIVMSAMSWYHVLCAYQYINGLEFLQTFVFFVSLFLSIHALRNVLSTNFVASGP